MLLLFFIFMMVKLDSSSLSSYFYFIFILYFIFTTIFFHISHSYCSKLVLGFDLFVVVRLRHLRHWLYLLTSFYCFSYCCKDLFNYLYYEPNHFKQPPKKNSKQRTIPTTLYQQITALALCEILLRYVSPSHELLIDKQHSVGELQ